MIKYLFISIVILTCINITITAQISPGARHAALSYSDVAEESDIFSLFNNPSGIANINCRQIGLFYSPFPYGLKELATGYFIYGEPVSFGNFAIGAMRFGFDLYRENRFSIGFADSISKYFLVGIPVFVQIWHRVSNCRIF